MYEDIQSSIIRIIRPLKGARCTSKDTGISVSTVCNVIGRVTKPRTVKNLRGRERKTVEGNLQMMEGTVEKHHIKDLKKYLEQCGVPFSVQKIQKKQSKNTPPYINDCTLIDLCGFVEKLQLSNP